MIGRTLALETLASSGLGAGLSSDQLSRVMQAAQLKQLPPGALILRQLEEAGDVYLPCSGTIMVDRNSIKGRRQVVGFLQRGDYLGFTSTRRYLYSATCLEDCMLLKFRRTEFERVSGEIPRLKENVATINNAVMTRLLDHLFAIGQKRAHERLAFFLNQLRKRNGGINTIALPMSRTDIGDYLGLTLETTSRAFSRLRQENIIRTPNHHSVVIEDLEALAQLAEIH
tara:strand:+ start:33934 stop:34614 length:681 start_codon:yes stop_codon:yes gene_type:complete